MLFSLSIFITVIVNVLLAVAVGIRNRQGQANRYFILQVVAIIGWTVTLFLYYVVTDPPYVLLLGRLNFFAATYISFFFFCLAYIFPRKVVVLPKWFLLSYTAATVIVSLLSFFTPLIDANEIVKGAERIMEYGPLYNVWFILICSHVVMGVIVIVRKLRFVQSVEKQQLLLLLWGFFLTFTTAITMNVIFPYGFSYYGLQPFGTLSTIIFVAATGYAIGKYQLFDIRSVSIRAVTYFIIIVVLGLIYAGILLVISVNFVPFSQPNLFLATATVMTVFVSLTFHPLADTVSKLSRSILYKQDYDLDKVVLALSHQMNATIDEQELIEGVLTLIKTTLQATTVAVYVYKDGSIRNTVTIPKTENSLGTITHEHLVLLQSEHRIVGIDEMLERAGNKTVMKTYDISVFVPLFAENIFMGSLLLGQKASGEMYYAKDYRLLNIVAPQFTLALRNANSYAEIKKFTVTLQEEVKKATEDLRLANDHLKELDKLKDEFLSMASHDLRTPMTAMKGYLWLMLKQIDDMPPEKAEKLRRIYNSSERMIALVNDMLDVSRIENGKLEIIPETFDVISLAKDVEQELSGQAQDRQLELQIDKSQSYIVHADRNKVHEILVNLISNAIKYSPEAGNIRVTFADQGTMVAISVADTGVGIAKEDIPKLFLKFGRLGGGNALTQVAGTGLGLYICKKLVELMGGAITVESTLGKGSVFTFTVPKEVESRK